MRIKKSGLKKRQRERPFRLGLPTLNLPSAVWNTEKVVLHSTAVARTLLKSESGSFLVAPMAGLDAHVLPRPGLVPITLLRARYLAVGVDRYGCGSNHHSHLDHQS